MCQLCLHAQIEQFKFLNWSPGIHGPLPIGPGPSGSVGSRVANLLVETTKKNTSGSNILIATKIQCFSGFSGGA